MSHLLRELSLKNNAACRAGEISFDGWVIKKHEAREISNLNRPIVESVFQPDLKQKRVDIKIGLDIACSRVVRGYSALFSPASA